MRKTILILVVGLAAASSAVAGCGGDDESAGTDTTETTGSAVQPGDTLLGSVGPGFDISLSTQDGDAVTSVPAGSYTIEVNDQADIHNFHLTGPGVDEATDVAAVGTETFDVELQAGTYEYVCDPHASSMNGSFEVTG